MLIAGEPSEDADGGRMDCRSPGGQSRIEHGCRSRRLRSNEMQERFAATTPLSTNRYEAARPAMPPPMVARHSHSSILFHANALNFWHNFF
jgi:hypothetical protein